MKLYLSFLLLIVSVSFSQVSFQGIYGKNFHDVGECIQQTFDGGYIITGSTHDGLGWNLSLVKTNSNGDTLWTKAYGGFGAAGDDWGHSVRQTADSGFIITGYTSSFSASYNYNLHVYLVKTNVKGDTLWTRTFGDVYYDCVGYSVQQTSDGGFIIAGDGSFNSGNHQMYLVKTDSHGNMVWSKTFGGSGSNYANSVQQTDDGGYILAGGTSSFGSGGVDVYLVRTDGLGNLLWSRTFGGSSNDKAYCVIQTDDGGFIIAGETWSFGSGQNDVYLIKTDSSGTHTWSKAYGNVDVDWATCIEQTKDKGFIMAGYTDNLFGNTGYLLRTDPSGNFLWSRVYKGNFLNSDVQETTDGGYVMTGYIELPMYQYEHGECNLFLVKTDEMGNSGCNDTNVVTIQVTANTIQSNPVTVEAIAPTLVVFPNTKVGPAQLSKTDICNNITGLKENKNDLLLKVFPNPSSGIFTVNLSSFPDAKLSVCDVFGNCIVRRDYRGDMNPKVDLSGQPRGLYFLEIVAEGERVVKKIVLE